MGESGNKVGAGGEQGRRRSRRGKTKEERSTGFGERGETEGAEALKNAGEGSGGTPRWWASQLVQGSGPCLGQDSDDAEKAGERRAGR